MSNQKSTITKQGNWEIDFYSRPIIDPSGKKRWELLITTPDDVSVEEVFKWEKI